GALLLGGRLADLLGRRRLFIAGLALFAVRSLLCGLAWSEGSLIAFRAVQGLGGALPAPAALPPLGERRHQEGERSRSEQCAAEALHRTKRDQRALRPGEPAEERA